MAEPIIKQSELKQYLELADEVRKLSASLEALRKSILARLGDGAEIQPGKLIAFMEKGTPTRRFSFDALVQILGLKKAEELKAQLPESISQTFRVVEA